VTAHGDPGYFGPGSVSWTVHAEITMLVAGITSLLMQALHPGALRGVLQHSGFREDPWGRLARTAEFVGVCTYGSTPDVDRAAARVRALHEGLGVDDPELLLWVHMSETASFLSVTRACGLRLSVSDADRYVREQVTSARLVGIDPSIVPGSTEDSAAYFTRMRQHLGATGETRGIARYVALPPMPARVQLLTPARAAWGGLASLAFGLLPGWARGMYAGPAASPAVGLAATAAGRALRRALLTLPAGVREGPHRREARERLGLAHVP
jgi:uncharacterized protein (DUF2236 family)